MSPFTSRVTEKYQATIPPAVRQFLDLKSGDRLSFDVENGQVILKKISASDWDYLNTLSGTMDEWLSDEDEEAYGDL